jgi:class 3 adenylate cyclase
VEAIGDDGWRHLLHWHDTMMRGLVGRHRGVVVSTTGDGFFITFDSAVDALACATAIQQALEEHRRTSGFALRVRSGFHRAEATWNGTDWSGSGVHVAARIGAIADGGEIIASRETAAAAGAGHRASLPRAVTLKGFSQPVEVVTIAWAGARS